MAKKNNLYGAGTSSYTGYTDVGGNNPIGPSATMLGGGRGASQAAQVQAINNQNAARQAAQETAIKNAIANAARAVASPTAAPVATPTDISVNGNDPVASRSSGGSYQQSATPVADPYADLYSIYEQQLNAQKNALEQQRQARLGALQSSYANAKNQLSGAFDSGENQINTDANNALRDSYINMMLNQKRLNQQLQSQGLNGGAMESSLARAYNDYGNSRNNIEQGRLDNIGQLLREYQNSLGDVETNYQNNLANLDADYSGNIANAVNNYYDAIMKLQQQNAASSLKNALGKSSASITASDSGLNKDIVNGLKNYKGNLAAARAYLTYMGVPEQTQNDYLMNGGFGADMMDDGSLASLGIAPTRSASNVTPAVRSAIINNLKRIYPTTAQDGLSANESLYRNVINQLNQYAQQYGLSDAEAQAILAEAGF